MIIEEFLNDNTLVKHYSDEGYILLQNETGNKYQETIDVVPCLYTYSETDEKIEGYEEDLVAQKARAYDILVGNEVIE